jgi:hypothetical protein
MSPETSTKYPAAREWYISLSSSTVVAQIGIGFIGIT